MNYVSQLNAFSKKRIGVLDAKEQAVYMALFFKANEEEWPEWFQMSYAELIAGTGIKHRNTLTKIKAKLVETGFIKIEQETTKTTQYHIIDLYSTSIKNEQVDNVTSINSEQVKDKTSIKNEQVSNLTSIKNEQALVSKMNKTSIKNEQALSSIYNNIYIYNKQNKENRESSEQLQSTICESILPPENKIPSLPLFIKSDFENKICPMPKMEILDKLAILTEKYGTDKTQEAIEIASKRNIKKIDYIRGVLENMQAEESNKVVSFANKKTKAENKKRYIIYPNGEVKMRNPFSYGG